jgi:hypothetical protein
VQGGEMGPKELLTEEEILKMLKINKAQLENYVREGKLSPLYQESVRKFKHSDVSKITGETTTPSPIEIAPPPENGSPILKTPKEKGSNRVIEPPKESREIGVNKTGMKFALDKESEKLLRPPEVGGAAFAQKEKWVFILLIAAFVISAFSVFMLTYNLKGKGLPQINKVLGTLGSIIPIGGEESNKIESETNSIIQTSQKTKQDAEALINETKEFIKIKE